MSQRTRRFATASALAGAMVLAALTVARADAFDKLQGYWAAKSLGCGVVFQKSGGALHFAKVEGYRRQGLIIRHDRVEAQNGDCEIVSHKAVGNSFAIGLSCKAEIIFEKLVVHVKLNGDNELVQFDADMPELTTVYNRCTM